MVNTISSVQTDYKDIVQQLVVLNTILSVEIYYNDIVRQIVVLNTILSVKIYYKDIVQQLTSNLDIADPIKLEINLELNTHTWDFVILTNTYVFLSFI